MIKMALMVMMVSVTMIFISDNTTSMLGVSKGLSLSLYLSLSIYI